MRRSIPLVLLLGLTLAPRASAHALGAECKLVGDRVALEAYYDDDSPADGARVRVEDGGKQVVTEGRTDARGGWSMPRPGPGRYTVVVDAGVGHRTQLAFTIPAPQSTSTPDAVAPPEPAVTISEDRTRQEFTAFPWLKLAIGLAVLGGLSAAFLVSRRLQRPGPSN